MKKWINEGKLFALCAVGKFIGKEVGEFNKPFMLSRLQDYHAYYLERKQKTEKKIEKCKKWNAFFVQMFEGRMLKAPPVNPWAYISRYHKLDRERGINRFEKTLKKF